MANILDYVKWRGDVPLRLAPLGDVDELVLCRLSYIPFEGVVPADFSQRPVFLCQAAARVLELCGKDGDGRQTRYPEDMSLLELLAGSPRYRRIRLIGFISHFDAKNERQFCGLTVLLPGFVMLTVFRGTDGTLVGWKEDFNMSFSDVVPAQRDAVDYLEAAAGRFRFRSIRLCGHSKGGNLAIFSAAFCRPEVQKRIARIRNNDGPGFNDAIVESEGYRRILPLVHSYLPQYSIFGMLLEHPEEFSIVRSIGSGIYQHNLYTWQVTPTGLVYADSFANRSLFIDTALKDWVAALTPAQREKAIGAAFEILREANVKDMDEFMSGKKNFSILRTTLRQDDETRRIIFEVLRRLGGAARRALPVMKDRTGAESALHELPYDREARNLERRRHLQVVSREAAAKKTAQPLPPAAESCPAPSAPEEPESAVRTGV